MAVVAVLADTHLPRGARRLPAPCVERVRAADVVLHAGDFTSLAFFAELEALGPPLCAVAGNVDDADLQAMLPLERTVDVEGAGIALVHDPGPPEGREARLASHFAGCAAVVYGHTHLPRVDRRGSMWILNPGSPTERRRAPFHSMLVLRVDAGAVSPELVELRE